MTMIDRHSWSSEKGQIPSRLIDWVIYHGECDTFIEYTNQMVNVCQDPTAPNACYWTLYGQHVNVCHDPALEECVRGQEDAS